MSAMPARASHKVVNSVLLSAVKDLIKSLTSAQISLMTYDTESASLPLVRRIKA